MKTKDILVGLVALALLGTLAVIWFGPDGLKPAPEVKLETLDGRPWDLAELRGRPVIVTFWATTCPGCIKEMPHLVELYEEFAPHGLEVIGIAMYYDPPEQVRELVARRQLPYTIAMDLSGEAAKAFGDVKLTPTTFVISPQGRIVKQRIGEFDTEQVRRMIGDMTDTAMASGRANLNEGG